MQKIVVVLIGTFSASAAQAGASFTGATKADKGPQACSGKAFIDPRLDDPSVGPQCWSCPDGTIRNLEPVTSPKACTKPADTVFADADFKHSWLCDGDKGEFYDPRKGGECWSCPKGKPRRTAYSVTSDKACATKDLFGEKLGSASFEHKRKDCDKGSFFDPRKGGECWKCPGGYSRTGEAVTSKKACAKDKPEGQQAAKLEGVFGCSSGQFFDPRNGGECWSCPKSHKYRTVNPVDGNKACTNDLVGVFAADGNFFCKKLVGAINKGLREGQKGMADLQALIEPVLAPVKKPLEEQVDKMGDLISDHDPVSDMVNKLQSQALKDALAFGTAVGQAKDGIRQVLLDDSICTAPPRDTDKKLADKVKLPASFDKQFFTAWVGVTFVHPTYHGTVSVALTWLTNLGGDGGLYVSAGLGATSSEEPFGVAAGGMFFPNRKLSDFDLSGAPSIGVEIAKGKGFETMFKGKEELLGLVSLVDAVDIAWSPETPLVLPTLGVAKSIFSVGGNPEALVDFSASSGWDFPVLTYKNWVLQ